VTVSLTDRRNARREPRFYVSDRDPADTYQPAEPESGSRNVATPAPSLISATATAAAPAARRARTGFSAWLSRSGARVRQVALSVAGLGAFSVAGFEAHPVAGWVVTGLSFLLLEHQVKS
jgi:hypothetical protein